MRGVPSAEVKTTERAVWGRPPERAEGRACHSRSSQRGQEYEEVASHGRGRLAPVRGWNAEAGTAA